MNPSASRSRLSLHSYTLLDPRHTKVTLVMPHISPSSPMWIIEFFMSDTETFKTECSIQSVVSLDIPREPFLLLCSVI